MSIEVERKRQVDADREQVKARLVERGYRETASSAEVDTYYSRPDVDYLATVECLRVRRRGGFAEITYKPASTDATRPLHGVVAKHETNVVLSDAGQADRAEALLEAIGMVRLVRVDKARTAWQHPARENTTVTVDTVAGAGVFVEVEIIGDDADQAAADLAEVEADLGLAGYPVVALPYRDIVRQTVRQPR
ncbi:class IV adenylate cyclase [Thermobifida halotolerans]|uniref:Class IV adenylate cyclase n=1 Tax=Thermobifida halotolerans TaxID=483545 RepID=A0A399FWQ4_9ACTN|nr:class IV adenylate cyclase [Thermobifida halotolerans]UOE21450.1 class IV adenylate cyclase [Thermobifida halotolerans]